MACHSNLKSSFYLEVPFHIEVRSFSLHQLIITFVFSIWVTLYFDQLVSLRARPEQFGLFWSILYRYQAGISSFAQLLLKDKDTEERRLENLKKKTVAPKLHQLTDVIRGLGSLGNLGRISGTKGNTKALKKLNFHSISRRIVLRRISWKA